MKTPGQIVKTKSGKMGRTKFSDKPINGKIPVYLATKTTTHTFKDKTTFDMPEEYSETAILCRPETLMFVGFID